VVVNVFVSLLLTPSVLLVCFVTPVGKKCCFAKTCMGVLKNEPLGNYLFVCNGHVRRWRAGRVSLELENDAVVLVSFGRSNSSGAGASRRHAGPAVGGIRGTKYPVPNPSPHQQQR
jgi:hypothetical protein